MTLAKVLTVSLIFLTTMVDLKGQNPLFPNSVVSNDIDFILGTDPDSFVELVFIGREDRETPQAPNGGDLFDTDTFIFDAVFSDGETMEIWCHSSFVTEEAAREYAEKLGPRLGKLPAFQRNMINHVVIHHESVHASYQFMYEDHPDWTSAQAADPTYVTKYAQDNPRLEDIAESALFAYTYLTYPGRLSSDIEDWLEQNIPNRLAFFGAFYSTSTKVENTKQGGSLQISPNPTNTRFTIRGIDKRQDNRIIIFDMNGNLLKSIDCSNMESIDIDLGDFANGLYLISMEGLASVKLLKYN